MIVVLDNAESILGLPETSAQEIHTIVDELSRFENIYLVITSRTSDALPPHCEIIEIPTLAMEAGQEAFYQIHRLGRRFSKISKILEELNFHPLSITLLATVAQQNRWTSKQLTAEWERRQAGVPWVWNLGNLAATVEFSLASPMFQGLGPDAREVLGVVAFFPQGVNEDNIGGVFPTISNGLSMFDTFCNLSLTYRSNGFLTMLAPLRDYLRPNDPTASPLLLAAKVHYFRRLSPEAHIKLGFDESRWFKSEDVNIEYLLDVFTSIDADSDDVWRVCADFMDHLHWHNPRLVVLGSKFEALPDNYPSKPRCLFLLSRLFNRVGNRRQRKEMLIQSLGLWKERGDGHWVADTLIDLADVNRQMGLGEEGINQAREASEIFGWLGETGKQARCLLVLAVLLRKDKQLDAAEEAATRAMDLSENRDHHRFSQSHSVLGEIHHSRGNRKEAIHHFEESLRVASILNWRDERSESHLALAILYLEEVKLNDAHTHIEHAKSHAGDNMLNLGYAFYRGAHVLFKRKRFEEAKLEALRALAIFEEIGANDPAKDTRRYVRRVERVINLSG